MTRPILMASLVAAATLALPSPGQAQNRERQQIMAEIRMLHEQTMRLQLMLSTLAETVEHLSARFDEQGDATIRAFADHRVLVDAMAGDVRELREKLDDTNVRISSMSQEVEALRVAIPPVPLGAELPTGGEVSTADAGASAPPAAPLAAGVSPQRMYDTAWADYTNGQWALAIDGFEAYLQTFPRSELADDAQFYIGQTHYADGNFEAAVGAFDRVLELYPNGDVIPEAAYKRGLALDRLGETDGARAAFENVVADFPDSTMAMLAQQALDRIRQQ